MPKEFVFELTKAQTTLLFECAMEGAAEMEVNKASLEEMLDQFSVIGFDTEISWVPRKLDIEWEGGKKEFNLLLDEEKWVRLANWAAAGCKKAGEQKRLEAIFKAVDEGAEGAETTVNWTSDPASASVIWK